jgi:hypothetical protein
MLVSLDPPPAEYPTVTHHQEMMLYGGIISY